MGAPWRRAATGVRCSDLASAPMLTCPTVCSGKVNTGALTTLEPADAGVTPPAAGAARPTPSATAAVAVSKPVRAKEILNVTLPGNENCSQAASSPPVPDRG